MYAMIIIKCHKGYAMSSATVAIIKSCILQVRQLKFYFSKNIYVWIYENGAKELKSRPKRAFFSRQKLCPKSMI